MLSQMRSGSHSAILKYTLLGLLLLASIGLALLSDQSLMRNRIEQHNVATIGREEITAQEFRGIYESNLRNQRINPEDALRSGLPGQILEREINSRIFAREAHDLGLIVDDKTAARKIKSMIAPLADKGVPEKQILESFLRANGVSEDQLVQSMKNQTSTEYLIHALSTGIKAPTSLTDAALKYRYEKRKAEYFKLTAADAGPLPAPTDKDLEDLYKSVADRYALPEYRTLDVLVVDKSAVSDEVKLSEEDLKKYYTDHISDYSTPEKRTFQQVIAQDQKDAQAVYDAAVKSKDMRQAAEVPGKGKANVLGDQSFAANEVPPQLASIFKGKEGEILPPVQSPLGWHVVYLKKIVPASVTPFDKVRDAVAKAAGGDTASDKLYDRASKIDDAVGGGKPLAEAAKDDGLKIVTLDKITAGGTDATGKKPAAAAAIPDLDKVLKQAFTLAKDQTGQMIEAANGSFVFVSPTAITPAAERPLADVKPEIATLWRADKQDELLSLKASKIVERVKLGDSFAKIAQDAGKSIEATDLIDRPSAAGGKMPLSPAALSALFAVSKEGDVTPVNTPDGVIILRLAGRKTDVPRDIKEDDLKGIQDILDRSFQNDIMEQFRDRLMSKYDVQINDQALADMFKAADTDSE